MAPVAQGGAYSFLLAGKMSATLDNDARGRFPPYGPPGAHGSSRGGGVPRRPPRAPRQRPAPRQRHRPRARATLSATDASPGPRGQGERDARAEMMRNVAAGCDLDTYPIPYPQRAKDTENDRNPMVLGLRWPDYPSGDAGYQRRRTAALVNHAPNRLETNPSGTCWEPK